MEQNRNFDFTYSAAQQLYNIVNVGDVVVVHF